MKRKEPEHTNLEAAGSIEPPMGPKALKRAKERERQEERDRQKARQETHESVQNDSEIQHLLLRFRAGDAGDTS